MRIRICVLLTTVASLAWNTASGRAVDKPNVIVILADDLGYADVGFNGCRDIPTPNIDRLARGGIRFTSGYVTHSFCSPSRAGLLTGRYQQRFGHENNPSFLPNDSTVGLPLDQVTLPEVLRSAGYATGMIGKWHLGAAEPFHPLNRGFDEMFGFLGGGHRYFPDQLTVAEPSEHRHQYLTKLLRNRRRVEETEYLTDAFSREAAAFVERHRDRPFFLYLSYNAPHTPLQATEKYLRRFEGIADKKRRTYAAMVSAVDDGVGRLADALRESGIERRTLVFFLSDNGGPPHANASDNTPLRGTKGQVLEGGIRVPFVASWPGTLPAGEDYDHAVSSLDIFPTAVALAGATVPARHRLDGVNLLSHITGRNSKPPHDVLFWRQGGGQAYAVRRASLKLVELKRGKQELYDLQSDIAESNDLGHSREEALRQLDSLKEKWNDELVQPKWRNPQQAQRKKAAKKKP